MLPVYQWATHRFQRPPQLPFHSLLPPSGTNVQFSWFWGFHFSPWILQKHSDSRIHCVAWNQFLENIWRFRYIFLPLGALNFSLCPRLLLFSRHPPTAPFVWLHPRGFFLAPYTCLCRIRETEMAVWRPVAWQVADKHTQTIMIRPYVWY